MSVINKLKNVLKLLELAIIVAVEKQQYSKIRILISI